jgi:putative chitinase
MKSPEKFFSCLTGSAKALFPQGLTQTQLNTINAILDAMQGKPVAHIAYVMATAYHEPGPKSRMIPNREDLYYTTAERLCKVWPVRFQNAAQATPYLRSTQKLANKVYNGRLGNQMGSNDGYDFRGGGLDHLTGRDHYVKEGKRQGINLVGNPDLILDPKVAVASLVHGMTYGRYRDLALDDFDKPGGFDYVAARGIVNCDVAANGKLIAGYAEKFEAALKSGGLSGLPVPKPAPAPAPTVVMPRLPAPRLSWFARLLKALSF